MDFEKERRELVRIHDFIRDKYPDNWIAENEKTNGFDPDNVPIDELITECSEFFLYGILGSCGCGCPEISIEAVCDYLDIVDLRHTESDDKFNKYANFDKAKLLMQKKFHAKYVSDNPLLQFMAYTLDDAGLTDHGSSIEGAWITDLGCMCKYVLRLRIASEEAEDKEKEDDTPKMMHTDLSTGRTRTTTFPMNAGSTEPRTNETGERFLTGAKYLLGYICENSGAKAVTMPIGILDYDGDPDAKIDEIAALWSTLVAMFGRPVDGKIRFGYITDIVLAYKFLEAVISSYEEVVAHGEGQEI